MKTLLFFVPFLLLFVNCTNTEITIPDLPYDYLIENGQIIDGTGSTNYTADILIHKDTIVYIGEVDAADIEVKKVINAKGKVITPGFIDAHAHGSPLETPKFENFLAMGVTTIILGQDGGSPKDLLEGWMTKVKQQALGVNIAMFVGHGTLRQMSGIGFDESPKKEQLEKQQQLLQAAFEEGVFGMSTGLEYTPGIFANDEELIPLAKIVGQNNGIIMSHIRNEDDDQVENSIQELLRQGAHCKVQVSHMKSVYGKGKERGRELLTLLEQSSNNTHTVTADVYPYTASYTGIGIVFPKWAKAPNNYNDVVKTRREELLAFLKKRIMDRNGPEATLFGTMPYAGKTLTEVSEEQGLPYEKVLLGIGPNRASGAYFIMDEDLQEEIIAHPKTMICSDGSPTMRHPRGYGSFAKIIEEFVRKRKRLTLEEAVRKMTSFPAQTIGLSNRGEVKVGNYADLLVFEPAKVKANATFSKPHQLASGFEYVFVNGKVAWQEEVFKNAAGHSLNAIQN